MKALLVSGLILLLWQGTVMADNSENRYNAYIHTQGSAWSLRVNDIFVRDNDKVAYADYSPNIGMNLRSGENTLSLLFSPVTGSPATVTCTAAPSAATASRPLFPTRPPR